MSEVSVKFKDFYAPAGVLCCHRCGEYNLHQEDISHDASSENIRIKFSCEHCPDEESWLMIRQHKGYTIMEWL